MLLICLQYFQASTSAAQAERQGQGEKEIDSLGIGEEDSIQHAAVTEPAETTGEVDKQM